MIKINLSCPKWFRALKWCHTTARWKKVLIEEMWYTKLSKDRKFQNCKSLYNDKI